MDDTNIAGHIEALVAKEHQLLSNAGGEGLSTDQHAELEKVKVELDQYWDLLRQRRAREEFGLDPDFVDKRKISTVENFEQ
jgi:Protein of unknown function (DUF2630)